MGRMKSVCGVKITRVLGFCSWVSTILLLTFIYKPETILQNPFLGQTSSIPVHTWDLASGFRDSIDRFGANPRRIVEENGRNVPNDGANFDGSVEDNNSTLSSCDGIYNLTSYKSRCEYVMTHSDCNSGGYLNYIKFFYCDCGKYSFLGYIVLGVWLAVLFYMLSNTASDYFCCSLEKLSDLLELSPTVAGVSLLPLGNGAPDVFSSVVAFMGTGSGDVGLNGVLGGAVFVTCIVAGAVSLIVSDKRVRIDKKCFIRDLSFSLFTILCLTVILIIGKVSIGGALAFLSVYLVYAFAVAFNEILRKKGQKLRLGAIIKLLPVRGRFFQRKNDQDDESLHQLLLNADHPNDDAPGLPHWIWNSAVAIYSDDGNQQPPWGWSDGEANKRCSWFFCSCSWFSHCGICWLLEMPLTIPRRLTIPTVEEGRWSKGYAVASATLAPFLMTLLWNAQDNMSAFSREISCIIGIAASCVLGVLAFIFTKPEHPPRSCLLPWVAGGFFMSIVWFYIIANELVALLESLGIILGISPSILALTIMAWGNSVGDFVSNTALAANERNGVQIAMSGSYAGPMFNVLIGLGVSLLLGAFSTKPEAYVVSRDSSLFYTMGFLAAGLIWSLIVLPLSDMHPNKTLGFGLITIYLTFLCLRIATAMGAVS